MVIVCLRDFELMFFVLWLLIFCFLIDNYSFSIYNIILCFLFRFFKIECMFYLFFYFSVQFRFVYSVYFMKIGWMDEWVDERGKEGRKWMNGKKERRKEGKMEGVFVQIKEIVDLGDGYVKEFFIRIFKGVYRIYFFRNFLRWQIVI